MGTWADVGGGAGTGPKGEGEATPPKGELPGAEGSGAAANGLVGGLKEVWVGWAKAWPKASEGPGANALGVRAKTSEEPGVYVPGAAGAKASALTLGSVLELVVV